MKKNKITFAEVVSKARYEYIKIHGKEPTFLILSNSMYNLLRRECRDYNLIYNHNSIDRIYQYQGLKVAIVQQAAEKKYIAVV